MRYLALCILCVLTMQISAQDLDQLLQETAENQTDFATATFKSTRIINGHSIERMPNRQLEFRISHRFGQLNTGAYNLWGLDQANIHFSLEYGFTNWVMAGIGRGTYEKTYDGFLKFSILRQSSGKRNMPISLSYMTSAAINTLEWTQIKQKVHFWSRVSYVHQLLIARKLSERFSVEINPTVVHRNIVDTEINPNDLFSVGAGARFKISKRVSFNVEYYYVYKPLKEYQSLKTFNPLSIGFDIETGGHVFQLLLTNSLAMIEKGFIGETTGDWTKSGIHLGFNISRVFSFSKKPE